MGLQPSPSGGSRCEASDSGLLESGSAVMVTSPVTSLRVENICLCGGGLPCFTHYSCSGLTSSGGNLGKQGWGRPLCLQMPRICPPWTAGHLETKPERGQGWSSCQPAHQPPLSLLHLPVSRWPVLTTKYKSSEHRNYLRERVCHTPWGGGGCCLCGAHLCLPWVPLLV